MIWMLFLLAQTPAQPLPSVETIRVTPAETYQFELGKNGVKGSRLEKFAWSPDRTELYVMTYEPNSDATIKEAFHYVLQVASGAMKPVDAAPAWLDAYWLFKSDRSAPGDPTLTIAVGQERKRAETGVATPMGGDYARGGSGDTTGLPTAGAIDASRGMQFQNVYIADTQRRDDRTMDRPSDPARPDVQLGTERQRAHRVRGERRRPAGDHGSQRQEAAHRRHEGRRPARVDGRRRPDGVPGVARQEQVRGHHRGREIDT